MLLMFYGDNKLILSDDLRINIGNGRKSHASQNIGFDIRSCGWHLFNFVKHDNRLLHLK